MMLIFWIALGVAAVLVFRWLSKEGYFTPGQAARRPSPLDQLRERYARGDIDREEFERIKRDLEKG